MQDLSSRAVWITGSTDGLGKLTATRLALRGATVLLHGRDQKKGIEVLSEIRAEG